MERIVPASGPSATSSSRVNHIKLYMGVSQENTKTLRHFLPPALKVEQHI